jgi:hypothetical protein
MADDDDNDDTVNNDSITESIFKHLSDDEKLTDDDRKSISEGLASKTGGKLPDPIKPKNDHWSEKPLW